jgi:hypothetical protein
VVDSDPRARELTGVPIERARRYYTRGPHPPRSGDIAYTEIVFLDT